MESTSTMNTWTEELAASLLPPFSSMPKQRVRRVIDGFRRRVRHHSHARTNQFDISDQLDGLEEKFQVLSRNDLSDALYERRVELRDHQERWIPDVLDLLLRLSNDPAHKTELADISNAVPVSEVPGQLQWADIEADDPLDRRDPIWNAPVYSDLSSDEDEIEASTTETSPASVKQWYGKRARVHETSSNQEFWHLLAKNQNAELEHLLPSTAQVSGTITVIQFIRHILHMLQGYPTTMFERRNGKLDLRSQIKLKNVSNQVLQAIALQVIPVRNYLDELKSWVLQPCSEDYYQTVKQMIEVNVQQYLSSLCTLEESLLLPKSLQVASIPDVCFQVEKLANPIRLLAGYVHRVQHADAIDVLDSLYEVVCDLYFSNDTESLNVTFPIFINAFGVYLKRLETWISQGMLDEFTGSFFVYSKDQTSTSRLWHDHFGINESGPNRAPSFMSEYVHDIFACGKTVAFIKRLMPSSRAFLSDEVSVENIRSDLRALIPDSTFPIPSAFSRILKNHFSAVLASSTLILKNLLDTKCGMSLTLNAFEYIYLRKQGVLLDTVEDRIFNRIDKCKDNWNDRFLVIDMLEDVYRGINCIDARQITIQSAHTSSRSMETRRRSVRLLGALAIDYTLPWPIANIISKTSMLSYRRIALHLLQIRRAKHILDNTAFIHVQSTAISTNPKDQLLAQATTFMLLNFTNTVYDHFTTSISLPMTTKMREDLHAARTVDAMITVHETYITNLEFACLTSKQLKMLRETLIGLLDMCIRFSDLVSTPPDGTARRQGSDDEAGSFVSARSQRRRKQRMGDGLSDSESDDDEGFGDEGEGYSSFVVLDEDTTVVEEIRKLQVQFKRQLDFFVAGLRGVGRVAAGATVEEFGMLADRLDWKTK